MEQLDEAREQLRELLRASGLTGRALAVASAVGQGVLRANLVLDRAFTQTLRREAEEAVEPVRVRILRGEVIVRRWGPPRWPSSPSLRDWVPGGGGSSPSPAPAAAAGCPLQGGGPEYPHRA